MAATPESLSMTSREEQFELMLFLLNKIQVPQQSAHKMEWLLLRVEALRGIDSNETDKVKELFYLLNRFLAELEHDSTHKDLLAQLKEEGIYTILYRKPRLHGDFDGGCRLVNFSNYTVEYVTNNIAAVRDGTVTNAPPVHNDYFKNKSGYGICSDGLVYFEYDSSNPGITYNAYTSAHNMAILKSRFPEEVGQTKKRASAEDLQIIHSITKHQHKERSLISSTKSGALGLGVAALLVILFTAVSIIGAPLWLTALSTGLFAGAIVYASVMIYSVTNGILAAKDCLPYFLMGHQSQQHSLVRSNNPVVQAVFWGIAAVQPHSTIAGILFAIGVSITALFVPPVTAILGLLAVAMPVIALMVDGVSKLYASYLNKRSNNVRVDISNSAYQENSAAQLMPTTRDHLSYHVTGTYRNNFGFFVMPILGVLALAAVITLSLVPLAPLAVLLSPVLAFVAPVVISVIILVGLAGLGLYAWKNKDTQTDDRNKLNFDLERDLADNELEFCFDERLDLVQEYRAKAVNNESSISISPVELSNSSENLNQPSVVEESTFWARAGGIPKDAARLAATHGVFTGNGSSSDDDTLSEATHAMGKHIEINITD